MQKTFIIILIIISAFISVKAQEPSQYSTWKEVITAAAQGKQDAAMLLLQAKSEIENGEKWDNETRSAYLTVIRALNEFCGNAGFYADQDQILTSALDFFNLKDGQSNSPYFRYLLICKTRALSDRKDYDNLIILGNKVLNLYNEANDHGYDYAVLCLNLAQAHLVKGELLDAKLFADEAFELFCIFTKAGMAKENGYFHTQSTRGMVYDALQQYDKAIGCFKEVVDGSDPSLLGSQYHLALNNLATTLAKIGRYDEAISLLNSVELTTPDLRYFVNQNLALAYFFNKDYSAAAINTKAFNDEVYRDAINVIQNFAETERDPYLTVRGKEIMAVNNIVASETPLIVEEAFDANLFSRSITLSINGALRASSSDLRLDSLRAAVSRKNISFQERDSLRTSIISRERDLLRNTPNLMNAIVNDLGNWKAVRSYIGKNEAMLLFCYLPKLYDFNNLTPYYGVFIAKKGDELPRLIRLCDVDDVEDIFYNSSPSVEFISSLYSEENARKLYQYLWAGLEPELKGIKKVYYSTIGPLATLNFDAFMNEKGQRLKDVYNLILLSSPTKIPVVTDNLDIAEVSLTAFGAPAFNISTEDMANAASGYNTYSGGDISHDLALRGELLRGNWSELPGTKKEVENILSIMRGKKIPTNNYFGPEANEEAFKAMNGNSPSIIHVATHGFVVSNQQQYDNSVFAQSLSGLNDRNSYMLWTGLVFAGGNNTWKGIPIPDGIEDGILTADEISRLDLSNTDLVVLSACETARGHIDPVEGVWGLQRAFKQAGVKTILMTLWKVPDATTAMFMEEFYKQLLAGHTIREAVKKAQNYLINNGADDPFYWAPFIVLD